MKIFECVALIMLLHHVWWGWWFGDCSHCLGMSPPDARATQLELLSPLILGLHVMWKTPWASSASSSDDRGFTCQLVFVIPLRFVVYFSKFNHSYVKYFPTAVFFFHKEKYGDYILFYSFWIKVRKSQCLRVVSEHTHIKGNSVAPVVKLEHVW